MKTLVHSFVILVSVMVSHALPQDKTDRGKPKLGVAAYDRFPEPLRSQLVKDWEQELAALKRAIKEDEERLSRAKTAKERQHFERVIADYKVRLARHEKNDAPYLTKERAAELREKNKPLAPQIHNMGDLELSLESSRVTTGKLQAIFTVKNKHATLRKPMPTRETMNSVAFDKLGNVYRRVAGGATGTIDPQATRKFTVLFEAPVPQAEEVTIQLGHATPKKSDTQFTVRIER